MISIGEIYEFSRPAFPRNPCLRSRYSRQNRAPLARLSGRQSLPGHNCQIQQVYIKALIVSALQRRGLKDPTRAAGNPGLCNKIDETLHYWANENDKGIRLIIADHTHWPVYENLSLTERIYLQSNLHNEGIKKKLRTDKSYFNAGSCWHPNYITGIEIIAKGGNTLVNLVKWGYSVLPEGRLTEANSPDEFILAHYCPNVLVRG